MLFYNNIMKLDCVVTACNTNQLYIEFIPYFIKAWNKLHPLVDIKIILIHDSIPQEYEQYSDNIILFNPNLYNIENIPTSFISQYIRLLYPCLLNYENGILITDLDMIPMNTHYYTKNIENIENNKFVYYRDVFHLNEEIAMCYNIAVNKTWAEIFNINSVQEIYTRLYDIYNNELKKIVPWNKDQLDLYKYVMTWNNNGDTKKFIFLNEKNTRFHRLDRHEYNMNETKLQHIIKGEYSDYHCLRPYIKNKVENDKILDLLQ